MDPRVTHPAPLRSGTDLPRAPLTMPRQVLEHTPLRRTKKQANRPWALVAGWLTSPARPRPR